MSPDRITIALWIAWLASWEVAAFWSDRTEKRRGIAGEILFRGLMYMGIVLLFVVSAGGHSFLLERFWRPGNLSKWLLAAVTALGLTFAWWARLHLGYLWSDWAMATKRGHRVVKSGPYRLVRHPIYSGLILAACATALQKGTLTAALGSATLALALYTRARREEGFLRVELDDHAYDTYARATRMWIPFLRKPN